MKFTAIVFCLSSLYASAQQGAPVSEVRRVIAAVDSSYGKMPREQVYLHFDKPYYSTGDTIWFKAYLTDASRSASSLSSILYVELFNDSNVVLKRLALPVSLGLARGDITLNEEKIPEGIYGIRAYTNWMRNFGESCFYYRYFSIGHLGINSVLVNETHRISGEGDLQSAYITLQLTRADQEPLRGKEMLVSVLEKKKVLYKEKLLTSGQGVLQVNCPLPGRERARYMTAVLEEEDNKNRTIVPIYFNNPQNAEVRFFPESGSLVAGLPARVAFKAVSEDGRGIDVQGEVLDSHHRRVAELVSLHKGVGAFELQPQEGETYTARVTLPGGLVKNFAVPAAVSSGTVLRITAGSHPDSLHVSVYFSPDLVGEGHKYVLIGQSRGAICYGANVAADKPLLVFQLPKRAFPTGLARLTLLNSNRQAVNERIFFTDQGDALHIQCRIDSSSYATRDSIALHLLVTDAAGRPVSGSLSISITDEGQVREDSLQRATIVSQLLLSSDLKGSIEDPAYYFEGSDTLRSKALDDLLLTGEWAGPDWKKVFGPTPAPAFLPETEFTVRGKVTNVFNKPLKQTKVELLGAEGVSVVKDTLTNDQGLFVFNKFPPFDTTSFFIEAVNRRGKEFNVGVDIEETPPPDLTEERTIPLLPWYVNTSEVQRQYLFMDAVYRREQDSIYYPGKGHALPVFTVHGRRAVADSKNLNGPANADQIIDEEQLKKDGKINLYQILQKEVQGFHEGLVRRSTQLAFLIREKRVRFIFDGVNLSYAMPNADYYSIQSFLETFTAEDIKGIEVMYNPSHTATYGFRFQSASSLMAGTENAYLEITTRSGHGPWQRHTPGTYLFRPQPFYFPRPFYQPRYNGSAVRKGIADLRSTIQWWSDVVTNEKGEVTLSFYAADQPTTYRILIEGSDMNGGFGVQETKITIRKP